MKNTTKANGAGIRAAKTSNPTDHLTGLKLIREDFTDKCRAVPSGELEEKLDKEGVRWDDLPRAVQVMVSEERAQKATVKCEIELPAWIYGYLCTAAAVRGLPDYKAALLEYLESTVTEWSNRGFHLEG